MTIEGLALTAGIHPTYLSSIERGQRNLSWQTLCFLAGALQVRSWVLVRRAERAAQVREGFQRVLAEEQARWNGPTVELVQDAPAERYSPNVQATRAPHHLSSDEFTLPPHPLF